MYYKTQNTYSKSPTERVGAFAFQDYSKKSIIEKVQKAALAFFLSIPGLGLLTLLFKTSYDTNINSLRNRIQKKQSVYKPIFPKISTITYKNKTYSLKTEQAIGDKEAGGKPQNQLIFENESTQIVARLKPIQTINEGVIYHYINQQPDSLLNHVPEFLGLFDQNGNQIDLGKAISERKTLDPSFFQQFGITYILMKDLAVPMKSENWKVDQNGQIQDFKFVAFPLQGNEEESKAHGYITRGKTYRLIRKIFFSGSQSPFAYQKDVKKKLSYISRFACVLSSQVQLKNQLSRLENKELKNLHKQMENLKESIKKSDCVFADSSLLFIPIVNEDGKRDLTIRLIDLGHGMLKEEQIHGFDEMKTAMIDSIEFLNM